MEQLDLLRNLEEHHNSLKLYEKELFNLKNNLSANKTEEKIIDTEDKLILLRASQEEIKKKLKSSNISLQDYILKIEEVEKDLYDGQIKDFRELEYLSDEKDKLKEIISDTETEILEFMVQVDIIDEELLMMEKSLYNIKDKNRRLKDKYRDLEENLKKKIQLEEDEIRTLESKINVSMLGRYNLIRKNKGTAVAEIKNNICSGCNMLIPTVLIDKLNKQEEIIYCESCGRILCKQ